MATWPWEPGFTWPWDAAQDTTSSIVLALVGLAVFSVGFVILIGWVQLPGGIWSKFLVSVPVMALGILMALGYIGGVV